MEIQISKLSADRRAEIDAAKEGVESVRREYTAVQARLAGLRPTIDVRVSRTVTMGFLGLQRGKLSEVQQRQNPEFVSLKDRSESLSVRLKEAEAKLARLLGD